MLLWQTLLNVLVLGSLLAGSPRIGVGLRTGPAGLPKFDILLACSGERVCSLLQSIEYLLLCLDADIMYPRYALAAMMGYNATPALHLAGLYG